MARVLFEDGDRITEDAIGRALLQSNTTDYVETGAGLAADFGADTVDVAAGVVFLTHNDRRYVVEPDAATLTLPAPNGENLVFARFDPDTDESDEYVVDTDAGNVADPKLQIGTVDGAGETTTPENRDPDGAFADLLADALELAGAMDAAGNDITDVGALDATTATVATSPSAANDVAIKEYVDDLFQGVAYQEPVISEQNDPPGSPATGDRYLIDDAPTGAWDGHPNEIAEWDGAAWEFFVPSEGWVVFIEDEDRLTRYNGTDWVTIASAIKHGSLSGLGDDDHTQYLLANGTRAMAGDLDMGGNNVTSAGDVTASGTTESGDYTVDGDTLAQSVVASGQVQLSSGEATVDTGISATDATFNLALGVDDPGADVDLSGRLFWDDSAGTYQIQIVEATTSVGNPTANYDIVRVS